MLSKRSLHRVWKLLRRILYASGLSLFVFINICILYTFCVYIGILPSPFLSITSSDKERHPSIINGIDLRPSNNSIPNRDLKNFHGPLVYFNKPDTIYIDEPVEIKAVISPSGDTAIQIDRSFQSLVGPLATKKVSISGFVTAKLSAPESMLEIREVDEKPQHLQKNQDLIFVWFVKALQIGQVPIRLDIFSQQKLAPQYPTQTIEVLQETWIADARGLSWWRYELSRIEPIRLAIYTLCGGAAATIGFFELKKKKEKKGDDQK